jgi:hypothetical protein
MFIVELILYSPRRIDCVAETACYIGYSSVSQTVVRGPQVVLRFCLCGPLRLNISPEKTEKIKLT